jgi:hypothetical protein
MKFHEMMSVHNEPKTGAIFIVFPICSLAIAAGAGLSSVSSVVKLRL